MGARANTPAFNVIGVVTAVVVISLSLVLLVAHARRSLRLIGIAAWPP